MSEESSKKPEEQPKPKRNMKKLVILAAAVLVAIGAGVGAVVMFGGGRKAQAAEAATAGHAATGETKGEAGEGAAHAEVLLPLESFVVNLSDPRGDRYMKLGLRCVAKDSEAASLLERNDLLKTRLRDRVLAVLSAKTFQEISNAIGKESLRRELTQEINGILGGEKISEVLFVEFVIQ